MQLKNNIVPSFDHYNDFLDIHMLITLCIMLQPDLTYSCVFKKKTCIIINIYLFFSYIYYYYVVVYEEKVQVHPHHFMLVHV